MSIAWPLLHHELCHTSYVQSNVTVCKNTFRWMSSIFLAVLTSDLISSFVRGLIVRLATARAGLHVPACHTYSSYNSHSSQHINTSWISNTHCKTIVQSPISLMLPVSATHTPLFHILQSIQAYLTIKRATKASVQSRSCCRRLIVAVGSTSQEARYNFHCTHAAVSCQLHSQLQYIQLV